MDVIKEIGVRQSSKLDEAQILSFGVFTPMIHNIYGNQIPGAIQSDSMTLL